MAPTAITVIWATGDGAIRTTGVAAAAIRSRGRSGVRRRAIRYTAWATMATAATSSPWMAPAIGPVSGTRASAATRPSMVMISALGRVNPSHAAAAPAQPARSRPTAIVSWLLAGPGSVWHSATRSANTASSTQPRSSTNALRW